MNERARELWAETRIVVWPERYMLVSLPHDALAAAASLVANEAGRFAALVVEADEVSATVAEDAWSAASSAIHARAVAGPYRAITLDLAIDLGVCGYLLPAAERLADAGISIVPQCAYLKDHLLVRAEDADRAVAILEALVRESGSPARSASE